jgi:hypothetical protein
MTGEDAPEPETGEITWRHRIEQQVHRLKRFLLKGVPYQALQVTRKAGLTKGGGQVVTGATVDEDQAPQEVDENEEA